MRSHPSRFSRWRGVNEVAYRAAVTVAAAAFTVIAVLLGASISLAGRQSLCRPAASFSHLPDGWAQQHSGCAQRLRGGSLNAWSGATSWRYRPDPNGPFHQMRPDRVLISVIVLRPQGFPATSPASFKPLRDHLLRLSAADQVATEEGSPTIPQYRFFRRVSCQYDLDLRVDFGRPHPSRTMMRAAQLALNGLVLPHWVSYC